MTERPVTERPAQGAPEASPTARPVARLSLGSTLALVAALNLLYFGIEIAVALTIRSVSIFADSVDFLEDTSVNLLILAAFAWPARARARLGMGLAALLLVPGLATLWMAWKRVGAPTGPAPVALGAAGIGALALNTLCAVLLARHRSGGGSLVRAAFLSARNDVVAEVGIVAASVVTALTRSPWPDLVTGVAIAALNAGAAWEVWEAALAEHKVSAVTRS